MEQHIMTYTDHDGGTSGKCSCGWSTWYWVQDGSAEADGCGHAREETRKRRVAVSDEFERIAKSIDDGLNEFHNWWFLERTNIPRYVQDTPAEKEEQRKRWDIERARWTTLEIPPCENPVHDGCSCHINPPCSGCEPCNDWCGGKEGADVEVLKEEYEEKYREMMKEQYQ